MTVHPPSVALLGREPAHCPAPGPCPTCSWLRLTSSASDLGRQGEPRPARTRRQAPGPARHRVSIIRGRGAGMAF